MHLQRVEEESSRCCGRCATTTGGTTAAGQNGALPHSETVIHQDATYSTLCFSKLKKIFCTLKKVLYFILLLLSNSCTFHSSSKMSELEFDPRRIFGWNTMARYAFRARQNSCCLFLCSNTSDHMVGVKEEMNETSVTSSSCQRERERERESIRSSK